MRDLAAKANVTPKTLYHQFGNKEKLLRTAVEERFRHTYQAIDDHKVEKGIDKLYFIIEAIAETTRKNMNYARALSTVLTPRRSDPFASIRMNTYKNAVAQIHEEGDFHDWIDLEVIAQVVYRHVNPLYVNWHVDRAKVKTEDFTKFDKPDVNVSDQGLHLAERNADGENTSKNTRSKLGLSLGGQFFSQFRWCFLFEQIVRGAQAGCSLYREAG